ncbi:tRNA modification GTPase MSS1 [Colletotrichum sidae]|uniref:tRNA modification GTPase MSS1 n=1 Tax=Colletotrichum sidae TaxID=1347389 RepID=A0A4R8TWM7_9PEZI|nr:tRNA modification GTPase MSS1 [Colletotrichum sidae]
MSFLIRPSRNVSRTVSSPAAKCVGRTRSDRQPGTGPAPWGPSLRPIHLRPIHRHTRITTRPHSRRITTQPEPVFHDDTIYALSTAQGRAGIAVVRISGPGCKDVYHGLCPSRALPRPRFAAVRTLTAPNRPDSVLDAGALVLYFPGPKTVTGEDVLELHVHGGQATVKAVLAAIPRCPSPSSTTTASLIRHAAPGEFTKRAFLNDRLDLAQVESLGDTLAADTEHQRRAAVRGTSGALGRTYESWRARLLLARGEIEALIDFSEDQHFDESPRQLMANVSALVESMRRGIRLHETAGRRSELLRHGIRIALLGPPNVGKSSLMNLVVGREASIVSREAGTTRDVVEVSLDVRGYLCSFADTAGIRTREQIAGGESALGPIEEEGIRRAKQKAHESDVIVVMAAVEPQQQQEAGGFRINYDTETLRLASRAQACLVVVNKRDAVAGHTFARLVETLQRDIEAHVPGMAKPEILAISCREAEAQEPDKGVPTQNGDRDDDDDDDPGAINRFTDELVGCFAGLTSLPADQQDLLGVTARQAQLLEQCRGFLDEFTEAAHPEDADEEPDIVLAAEHLRYAADCLAKITGRVEAGDVEEVLGVIFEK